VGQNFQFPQGKPRKPMSHIAAGRSAPWTELYKSQQGGAKVGTAAFEAVLMAHLLDMGLMCF